MRRLALAVGCVFLFAMGTQAQDKINVQWKCAKPSIQHSIDTGEKPGHAYVLNQTTCTATKGEIGGVQEKDGVGTEMHDVKPTKSSWHGIFVETLSNGDKLHFSYSGTGTMKDGQFVSGTDTWNLFGGTGKFSGAKGSGGCKGTGNADGTSTWNCEGTYHTAGAPAKKM